MFIISCCKGRLSLTPIPRFSPRIPPTAALSLRLWVTSVIQLLWRRMLVRIFFLLCGLGSLLRPPLKWCSPSYGTLWAGFTCEHFQRFRPHQPPIPIVSFITQFLRPTSWEYFTTLDYEWSVIRGRRPYRRTIWVRRYMRLTLVSSAAPVPGLMFRLVSIDLLSCTSFRPFDRTV